MSSRLIPARRSDTALILSFFAGEPEGRDWDCREVPIVGWQLASYEQGFPHALPVLPCAIEPHQIVGIRCRDGGVLSPGDGVYRDAHAFIRGGLAEFRKIAAGKAKLRAVK